MIEDVPSTLEVFPNGFLRVRIKVDIAPGI